MKKQKLFECIGPNKFKLYQILSENVQRISADTYSTTIIDPETEQNVPVTITVDLYPGEKGSREKDTGLQLTPDYEPELSILSITDSQGKDYLRILPKSTIVVLTNDIRQEIINYASEDENQHSDFLRQQDQYDRL